MIHRRKKYFIDGFIDRRNVMKFQRREKESGQVLVILTLGIVVLLGFAALAIDQAACRLTGGSRKTPPIRLHWPGHWQNMRVVTA